MKKTIWKFELNPSISGNHSFKIPKDSEILTVQMQNNNPCIWVLVNPNNEVEERFFELFGTGHDVYCDMGIDRKYINTVQMQEGSLVFHIFERL